MEISLSINSLCLEVCVGLGDEIVAEEGEERRERKRERDMGGQSVMLNYFFKKNHVHYYFFLKLIFILRDCRSSNGFR